MNINDQTAMDNLIARIHWGMEERNLEYKQSLNWDTPETKAKLTKSVLAMANLRDGGSIIIGVGRRPDDSYVAEGMNKIDFDSFVQDHVAAHINEYADPYVEVTLTKHKLAGKLLFCILEVTEFAELPVVCKKDGFKLRRGATYTRARRINETVEVPTQVEMREILDLAIEKGVRSFHTQVARLNFQPPAQQQNDEVLYFDERKRVKETDILKSIWNEPHWHIWVFPKPFMTSRFRDQSQCKEFINRSAVRSLPLGDYPYVNLAFEDDPDGHWIAGEADMAHHLERWTLFRSGQFIHNRTLSKQVKREIGNCVHFLDIIRVVSQVFEFTARMAYEGILSPTAVVVVELKHLDSFGQSLGLYQPTFCEDYWSRKPSITVTREVPPMDLEARNRDLALGVALDIYKDFGWTTAPLSQLKQEQERIK